MRGTFLATLADLADQDSRIFLLTADLGFMAIEPFANRHPQRFLNVGVSEQNMIGAATGLAQSGFVPFAYSIVPFAVHRPFEFIRNGPILHQLPVRIVGVGAGFDYGTNGLTHYGIDDVAVLRSQPGITIVSPADARQAGAALRTTYANTGPIYYRLGKDDRVLVPELRGNFTLGLPDLIYPGEDVCILSMGAICHPVAIAVRELAKRGVSCAHMVVSTISPVNLDQLAKLISKYSRVVTVENHYVVGGLGSLISEVIAQAGLSCRLSRIGVRTLHDGITGSTEFLNERHGINVQSILDAVFS